jgi:DHA2 family multidrug resistance protein
MIAFRALQGFTGGALIPMAATMVLTMLPASKQPVGFALFGMSAIFAPAIGPTIGGWITENFSWPWVFYMNLIPGAALLGAVAYGLDAKPMNLGLLRKGDWLGITLMALGLGSLTVFLEEGTRKDWFGSAFITRLAIVATVALPLFVIVELMKRKNEPLLNLRLFARRNFALGSIINLAFGFGLYGVIYLLPIYLAQVQGYNALQIGETMMWVGLPQLFILPLVPRVMQFIDKRILIGLGLATFAWSCLLMSHLTTDSGQAQLVAPQLVRAVGFPFIMVPLSLVTTGGIEHANVSSASGLFNMLRNLGGSIGIAMTSALLAVRERFHSHHLGEVISLYNPLTRDRLETLTQTLTNQGLDAVTASKRALGMMDLTVRKQAYLLAYSDSFHAMALVMLAMIPLLFFCRETKGASPGGAH